jgi:hypothetical protein
VAVLSYLLPQGEVISIHIYSGLFFTGLVVLTLCCHFFDNTPKVTKKFNGFHHKLVLFGYFVIVFVITTGLMQLFSLHQFNTQTLHLVAAMLIMLFFILHGIGLTLQFGWPIVRRIASELFALHTLLLTGAVVLVASVALLLYLTFSPTNQLTITTLTNSFHINIDGKATEKEWRDAPTLTVKTFSGHNFTDGQTSVKIKAINNNSEVFFLFQWLDSSESLEHLPLVKTKLGWRAEHDGYQNFNEKRYYEDKFAVMLSTGCDLAADGSAHLGHKPLANKPANLHGKGFHYTDDNKVIDLWQWKAIRTDNMKLADDNFIGPPLPALSGNKRYTAGYYPDAKESGRYSLNWTWFKQESVVPKRLPIALKTTNKKSYLPWFHSKAYTTDEDDFEVGTTIPSVLYRSNRFEGDRADVAAKGYWQNGQWTLELARKLKTGSSHDVDIQDGICIWVAPFDHSQIGHSRHIHPIKLRLL